MRVHKHPFVVALYLPQAFVASLPTKIFQLPEVEGDAQMQELPLCSICYEPVHGGEKVFAMACTHVQHHACMSLWVVRKPECPECRRPLPLPTMPATPFTTSGQTAEGGQPDTAAAMSAFLAMRPYYQDEGAPEMAMGGACCSGG